MAFFIAAAAGDGPNYDRLMAHRPDVNTAWRGLNGAIKAGMDPRRYELATLAAARALRSSYCSLAHGSVMIRDGLASAEELEAMALGHHAPAAGLSEAEMALMDLAAQVARDATAITQADVDRLRALGLSDTDVFDVVTAAAARCFFSKTLDALGVPPDASYRDMEPPALRDALTVGRAIES
jgi:uncharacterized peroxidase-related enzyme